MILSASRRTDIPCFHGAWLINRLHEGCVMTRNPMNPRQLSRITFSPQTLDCIVFWTKNPGPFLPLLTQLDHMGYRYYFQYTLTPYGSDLEPGLPPKEALLEQFAALGRRIGPDRLVWRYDPIVLTPRYTTEFHEAAFAAYCRRLAPYTDEVVISFLDLYARLRKSGLRACTPEEMAHLAASLGRIAASCGLTIRACSEPMDLTPYGIRPGSCIDRSRLKRVIGAPLQLHRAKGQRPACGCCESVDIGAYNTCLNGCRYCYASYGKDSVQRSMAACDPASPLLTGWPASGDTITDKRAESCLCGQLSL